LENWEMEHGFTKYRVEMERLWHKQRVYKK